MLTNWKAWLVVTVAVAVSSAAGAAIQAAADDSGFAGLYRAGQAAMAAGRYDQARATFEQLEKMDASVAEVHATLGVLSYKLGDFNRAIDEIRTARRLKPGLPGLDALLALSLAESGKDQEALPGLEKAFRSSTDPEVKRQAGLELTQVYTHLSMDRKAVETALDLRDRYKNDPEVLYEVGKVLGNSAYLTMEDLFHNSGDSVWAQLAEAEAFESQGQFASAIQAYEYVLKLDPHRANIHYRMGRTYLSRWEADHSADDLAAAAAEFAKEIEIDPANANADYELAGLRWKNGDAEGARKLYEAAVEHYPEFEEAEVGLGGVLLDEQKSAQAAVHLQHATVLRPDDEVAWYRLAQAEREVGDRDAQQKAMATFQQLRNSTHATLRKPNPSDEVTPQQIGTTP